MRHCHSLLVPPVTQADFQIISTLARSLCRGSICPDSLPQYAVHADHSHGHESLSCSTASHAGINCPYQEQGLSPAQRALNLSSERQKIPADSYILLPNLLPDPVSNHSPQPIPGIPTWQNPDEDSKEDSAAALAPSGFSLASGRPLASQPSFSSL